MREFVFKATIDAVVRVRAADENAAREVVPTVLGAPGTVEIRIANEAQAAVGRDATEPMSILTLARSNSRPAGLISAELTRRPRFGPLAFVGNNPPPRWSLSRLSP